MTWTDVSSGLGTADVHSLAISGTSVFAASVVDGVFHSTDDGASWSAVNSGLLNKNVWTLAVSGSTLYAGTNGAGVWRLPL